jgi:peptidoglycan hydrolase CwlO-like protein
MPKILLGISAALAIAASVLGFLSGGKATEMKNDLTTTKGNLEKAQSDLTVANKQRKDAEDARDAAKVQAEQTAAELATAKGNLEKAQKEADEAKGQIQTINTQLDSIKATLKAQGVENVDDIAKLLTDMNTKLKEQEAKSAEMETKVKEAETLVTTLTQRTKDAEAKTTVLQDYHDKREKHMIAKGLEGQVLAVNQSWNFVVLSIGDGAGVVANAEMIVMRGGEAIAKVKITSVEKATSVADIVPGSTAHGVRVQPGDRVIYQGSQG